jgi:hypothetical protein
VIVLLAGAGSVGTTLGEEGESLSSLSLSDGIVFKWCR